MPAPPVDLDATAELIERGHEVITSALGVLDGRGGIDANETLAYDLAHAASSLAAARSCLTYAARGDVEARLVAAFLALALSDLAGRVLGRESSWGLEDDWFTPFRSFVTTYRDPSFLRDSRRVARAAPPGRRLRDGGVDVSPLRR